MYIPDEKRYESIPYRRTGKSGLMLPAISLGLWHNFGEIDDYKTARNMIHRSFDMGITHFDLANNYGPPPGSAETVFGKMLKDGLGTYRDELIISTKAGLEDVARSVRRSGLTQVSDQQPGPEPATNGH